MTDIQPTANDLLDQAEELAGRLIGNPSVADWERLEWTLDTAAVAIDPDSPEAYAQGARLERIASVLTD